MLYRYSELLKSNKFNLDKKIKEALKENKILKLDCGFYSEKNDYSELEFISKKYNNAILKINYNIKVATIRIVFENYILKKNNISFLRDC